MHPPCKREIRVQLLGVAPLLPWCKVARPTYDRLALDVGAVRVRVLAGGPFLRSVVQRAERRFHKPDVAGAIPAGAIVSGPRMQRDERLAFQASPSRCKPGRGCQY